MKQCKVSRLCFLSGISRQAFYAEKKERERAVIDEEKVLEEVNKVRTSHPRMGVRKLMLKIRVHLLAVGIEIGRDRLFNLLRDKNLLIKAKGRWICTTNSDHALPVFRNQLKDLTETAPHQVWVADITYVSVGKGHWYLSLVMDRCSRTIVGWNLADNLQSAESVKALEMAISQLPRNRYPIHHSDRGSQYCCKEYVEVLNRRNLPVSMTEENHCYENAHAERINRTLKDEYNINAQFRTPAQALIAVRQAIDLYNNQRPHNSLGGSTPCQVHRMAA